jgi:REP element-mobilizing transposase RayT
VQVTLKMKPDIKNLRRRDVYRKIEACLRQAATRDDAPICDFSVQGDHVHMLVDAANNKALTSAVRGVSIRVARAINKFWGRKGRVFSDRYHARLLRSPTEVLISRRYILNNYRKHLPERLKTERTQPQAAWIAVTPKHVDVARQILEAKHWIDPYSSAWLRRKGTAWPTGHSWTLSDDAAAKAERYLARRQR